MAVIREGNKAALVVVDMQVGVMAQAWDAARVVGNAARAVQRARTHGVPVIWVQHENEEMPHGGAEWQWVPELKPAANEARVYKKFNSSFENTDLESHLANLGVAHIALAGAMTNWCIRATAYGALDRGYDLTLIKDAHTTADIDLGNGSKIDASNIVTDLNVAMRWLEYPGRANGTATAETVDFATPGGTQ
jgi:nicotinamidase-related amidase